MRLNNASSQGIRLGDLIKDLEINTKDYALKSF